MEAKPTEITEYLVYRIFYGKQSNAGRFRGGPTFLTFQCYEHRQNCVYQILIIFFAAVTLGYNTFLLNEFHNNDPR